MSRLNLAKPYRGFESTSLRHTVWVAEKFGCLVPKIVQNRRNSSTSALKQDRRKCPAFLLSQAFMRFSLEGRHAVRFQCPLCGGTMQVVERLSVVQLLLRSPPYLSWYAA